MEEKDIFSKDNFEYKTFTEGCCIECGKPSTKMYTNTKVFNVNLFCENHDIDTYYKSISDVFREREYKMLFGYKKNDNADQNF